MATKVHVAFSDGPIQFSAEVVACCGTVIKKAAPRLFKDYDFPKAGNVYLGPGVCRNCVKVAEKGVTARYLYVISTAQEAMDDFAV